jgi:hypothetical protein
MHLTAWYARFTAEFEASTFARFLPVDPQLRQATLEILAERTNLDLLEADFEWRAKADIEQAAADARAMLDNRRRREAGTALPLSPTAWLRWHVAHCIRPREAKPRRVRRTAAVRGSPARRSDGEPHHPDLAASSGGAA